MNLDKEFIKERITELREDKSCSQATLIALCEAFDSKFSFEELSILASGFSGGIGGTFKEGTCGAVTGAIMALGLICSDESQIKSLSKEIFNSFRDEYSSARCDVISKCGEDKSPCVDVCIYTACHVIDLLKENE